MISIIILAIISGLAYWAGGQGADGHKNHPNVPTWMFDRLIRHIICPICAILAMTLFEGWNEFYIMSGVLMFAATSCYWNFIHPKEKKTSWNWFLHGFGIGMSMMPWGIDTNNSWLVFLYAQLLALSMMVWSDYIDKDFYEEFGRGALIILLIVILFI